MTLTSSGSAPFVRPSWSRPSIEWRNAASVFPDPVGAAMSVSRPERIERQPRACARVGAFPICSRHQRWMTGWKEVRFFMASLVPRPLRQGAGIRSRPRSPGYRASGAENRQPRFPATPRFSTFTPNWYDPRWPRTWSTMELLYLEDFSTGEVFDCGTTTLSLAEIVQFARQFDPQPF